MESNTYENFICPLCGGELLWMTVSHIFVCEHCKNSFSEDEKFYLHRVYMPREKSKGSAPPRNCDRFAEELDAQLAFLNEVWLISVDRETMLDRDKYENWSDEMRTVYGRWLLANAKEVGSDGSK